MTELSDLILTFIHKRRRPTDIGTLAIDDPRAGGGHDHKRRRKGRRTRPRCFIRQPQVRKHLESSKTQIIGDSRGLHVELHPIEGVIFRNGRSPLLQIKHDGTITHGEGTSSSTGTTDADLVTAITTHTADPDAHHNWPPTLADLPPGLATDAELSTAINTHTADPDAHHRWPLLDADIPGTIARDSELATAIATHTAVPNAHHNWPLTDSDIPATIARDSELTTQITTHTADADAHHNWPLQESDIPAAIARDTEVTAQIATHTADPDAHHNWPLTLSDMPSGLATDAELAAAISTHTADADAHHRWPLLDADIPATIARDSEVTTQIANHTADADAHHNWPLQQSDIPDAFPTFQNRRGGSATNWTTPGTTNYTAAPAKMQGGAAQWTGSATSSGDTAVTFPAAYTQPPLVVVSVINTSQGPEEVRNIVANPFNITPTGFEIGWLRAEPDTNTYTILTFSWLSFGPE